MAGLKIQQAAGEHPELSVQQRRPSHGGHDLCQYPPGVPQYQPGHGVP